MSCFDCGRTAYLTVLGNIQLRTPPARITEQVWNDPIWAWPFNRASGRRSRPPIIDGDETTDGARRDRVEAGESRIGRALDEVEARVDAC